MGWEWILNFCVSHRLPWLGLEGPDSGPPWPAILPVYCVEDAVV